MLKQNKPDMRGKVRHLQTVADLSAEEIMEILQLGQKLKNDPHKYAHVLDGKTMLMLFEKPSLRTRVSFETGMTQLGGHAIYYSIAESPMGKGETVHDTAQCLTQYVDIVMARVKKRETIVNLCKDSGIPVLNGLDDFGHPCQIVSDMFTILEQKGTFKGVVVCYFGDIDNNVTYDLMRAVTILGGEMRVAGPKGEMFVCDPEVIKLCEEFCKKSGGKIKIYHDPKEAATGADVIYTDSWMSYHIDPKQQEERVKQLTPFKVTQELLNLAKPNVTFMNCLPANRSMEQTPEVIDGPRSIVFTQAGNRLHIQKAIVLFFLGMIPKDLSANKVLVALGGNALIQPGQKGTHVEQFLNAETACRQLAQLVKRGFKLVVTHGNGPQVGHIYLQNEFAKDKIPQQPLFCNGSSSQGFIGFMMQNKLQMALLEQNVNATCATIVSQSVVDKNDPAFQNPTKPVGKFYTEAEAEELRKQGYTVKEDSGRGYRIVVPSPQPIKIVEIDAIKAMVEGNVIPICCGGGGIPVIEDNNGKIIGIDSVIDKDLCAEVLAGSVGVDSFMILTDVDGVYMNYRKENQTFIHQMTAAEARKGLAEKQFGEGSMYPKVLAACKFVEKTGKTAIITSLNKCVEAMDGKAGTRIIAQ